MQIIIFTSTLSGVARGIFWAVFLFKNFIWAAAKIKKI